MSKMDNYEYTSTTQVYDGITVITRHPILTQAESERRIRQIKDALCRFYESCQEQGVPFPGDPGYEDYVEDYNRRHPESTLYRDHAE